ncbi:glutaminase A [Bacillus spizizenii]|uniref:glutaminase A n=1 Tax=Bacillus spizizenii TaxID=96241 RepID=UPI00086E117F|nr:glutaminase A [Bacillus spizizenii]MED0870923.1 glutaminase A [Bacillus spizizenii]MED1070488.1 glutaminase A [Bacillus spizizenii]SCV41024.1 Glutaminase [Bacillus subtilis]
MVCRHNDELEALVKEAKKVTDKGEVASYIPALAKVDKHDLSVAIYYSNNICLSAGDVEKTFTLQSISKVLSLALVLMEHGKDKVFSYVGQEPTGDPFNSIIKLETVNPSKPLNPMINAGALVVTSLIRGKTVKERLDYLLSFIRRLTNNQEITYCREVAQSEYSTSMINRAMCYYMKQYGIFEDDVEAVMDLYTKQCAIEMNSLDLAKIGSVFALNGRQPETGEQIIPKDVARICKTFMVTCGMYNASGEFAIKVGIPAKSGVSGGIMGLSPYDFGIGIFGPALDDKGNSIAGVKLLEIMSEMYRLSIF